MRLPMIMVSLVGIAVAILAYHVFVYDDFWPESVAGKRVLVTGASSGIGEEIAYVYARMGASLVIVARRRDLLERVADKCKKLGAGKIDFVVADLAVPEDCAAVIGTAKQSLGGLDHLILNHGIMRSFLWRGSPQNMTTLRQQMDVNFFSYVYLVSLSLSMLKESRGNIGIVSSVAARLSSLMAYSYSASKFALDGFFVGYREELKLTRTGISVSIAYPGYIDTEAARSVMRAAYAVDVDSIVAPVSAAECATTIVRGVATRRREIIYPLSARIILLANSIAPDFVTSYFSRKKYGWLGNSD